MATQDEESPTLRLSSTRDTDDVNDLWLVSFSDDDDRELRPQEIAEALARGEIDGETIVWRDGLSDWLPIASVPSLAKLLVNSGRTRAPSTITGGFLGTGMPLAKGPPRAAPSIPRVSRKSEPPPVPLRRRRSSSSAPPPVPRRGARKPAPPLVRRPVLPIEEIEEEALSVEPESLRALAPPAEPSPSMPDARALSAGTLKLGSRPTGESEDEGAPSSGTPSLNALAAVSPRSQERASVDVAPIETSPDADLLAPPTIDLTGVDVDAPMGSDLDAADDDRPTGSLVRKTENKSSAVEVATKVPEKKGTKLAWLLLAALALGAIVLFARTRQSQTADQAEPAEVTDPSRALQPAAVDTQEKTLDEDPHALTPEEPPPPEEPVEEEEKPTKAAAPTVPPPKQPAEKTGSAPPRAKTTERPSAPEPAPPKAPSTSERATSKPSGPTPAATSEPEKEPVSLGGPFDKSAAAAALESAAAQASACRQEGDPSGRALVRVTFADSGRAVRATVEGPPFAGTRTGGCIASTMRRASVPPFGGDRITVSKTVLIR